MKIYKVGGYVRDTLLGLTPTDCDYVVVGSTPEEMLSQGYVQVGKSFPVFLHPKTHEEYALARNEIKIGHKHQDFAINANPTITLEEDLSRRDLTINAIAEDSEGNLIDPYNGIKDLREGILRHISPAFKDDPLRILRIARFSATLGFCVASETMLLLKEMANQKAGLYISRERVVNELNLALNGKYSQKFFKTLANTHNLIIFFPTLSTKCHTKQQWVNFCYLMSSASNKWQKYTILAYYLPSTTSLIKEITLSRDCVNYIKWTQLLINSLSAQINPNEILLLLKTTCAVRDFETFKEIAINLEWMLQKATDNKPYNIQLLKKMVVIAKELKSPPISDLVHDKMTNVQIQKVINNWQLNKIIQLLG